MLRSWLSGSLFVIPLAFLANAPDLPADADSNPEPVTVTVRAEIVAIGIPGAGAIAQVGAFHKGGPFRDNPVFAAATQRDQVLDPNRLFVASTSNFGAPLARSNEPPGSILSLDVSGIVVATPPLFAAADGQATAGGGKVILYAAQSPAFLNSLNNPGAVTNDRPSVSLPRGISFNNGFGRPWFANAPSGSAGDGTITVTDPSGIPLAGAPSTVAGGVFAGNLTNRSSGSRGLTSAALATALVTKSPDLSIRAVFFAALADGSIAQIHVQKGVDGLAPPGSFTPIPSIDRDAAESSDPHAVTRVGMIFNWAPERILYVTDPLADRILVLDISGEGATPQDLFQAKNARYLRSRLLNKPVDMAPAIPEVAARNFASNTTLGAGSDFYVLNRGDNTVVRMRPDGRVIAARRILADLPGIRVNGLAVSDEARTLWITATGPGRQGVVLRIPAFGAGPVSTSMIESAKNAGASGVVAQGLDMFKRELNVDQSLGPLFNGRACISCHNTSAGVAFAGGMGVSLTTFVTRIGRIDNGQFHDLPGHGPVARQQSIASLGEPCHLPTGVPRAANATSKRSAMTLRGSSLIDNIRLADIEAVRAAQPSDVRGRFNILSDGRAGRFGWKAQTATLVEFMGDAFRDEIGITNPLTSRDFVDGCGASKLKPEMDGAPLTSVVAFLNTVDPPVPDTACRSSSGAVVFTAIGCANCHSPSLPGPGAAAPVFLYSDLLLHDMGPGLADGFVQGSAIGSEFRTMPLWRVADRQHFLHDGRAATIVEAIQAHGGQAGASKSAFRALRSADQQALLQFLNCI